MALTDALRFRRFGGSPAVLSLDGLLERWQELLISCLPTRLAHVLAPRDQALTLIPLGDKAVLYRGRGEDRETLAEIDLASSETALAAFLEAAKGANRRTRIELPREQVMSRIVSLPSQVRKNLGQVINYEIDRLTPFRPDQICFDFRPLDAQSSGGKLAVEIALCRRDLVSNWLDRLRNAGASVEQILWEDAWPKANLLPASERPQGSGHGLSPTKLLLVLVLCLAAAAMIGPIWQKNRSLEALEQQRSELKDAADEVYQLRDAIERAREGSIAVLENKAGQPRMIDLLRELTDRLPDDTWVQNLDYREGEVQIRGESSQAAALISLLERAPGFEEVVFRSPVVQVAATGQERFHIAFRYARAEPAP
jgi:general secretion pathway protein L